MSVCQYGGPFVRVEQLGSYWTDFYEIRVYSEKSIGKFKFH